MKAGEPLKLFEMGKVPPIRIDVTFVCRSRHEKSGKTPIQFEWYVLNLEPVIPSVTANNARHDTAG